jgi:hypothetical protein
MRCCKQRIIAHGPFTKSGMKGMYVRTITSAQKLKTSSIFTEMATWNITENATGSGTLV